MDGMPVAYSSLVGLLLDNKTANGRAGPLTSIEISLGVPVPSAHCFSSPLLDAQRRLTKPIRSEYSLL